MHQHQRAQGTSAHTAAPAPADVPAQPPTRQPATEAEGAPSPTRAALRPVWHQVGVGTSAPAASPAPPASAPAAPSIPTAPSGEVDAAPGVPPAVVGVPPHPAATSPAPVPSAQDVRAAARASLAAGRSASLWWVSGGLLVSLVVAWTVEAARGALVLAVLLAVSAILRAALPRGPVALTVRSRATDTAVLLALALGVGILSQVIPTAR
jgi:hypothetical protein